MSLSKKFIESGLLSTGAVAKRCGVDRSTPFVWIKSKMLKSTKVDGYIGVKESDLKKFLAVYNVNGEKKT